MQDYKPKTSLNQSNLYQPARSGGTKRPNQINGKVYNSASDVFVWLGDIAGEEWFQLRFDDIGYDGLGRQATLLNLALGQSPVGCSERAWVVQEFVMAQQDPAATVFHSTEEESEALAFTVLVSNHFHDLHIGTRFVQRNLFMFSETLITTVSSDPRDKIFSLFTNAHS